MPEGPLGFPRPFAEQKDTPLYIFIEYDADVIDFDQFKEESNNIVNDLEEEGIVISDVELGILTISRHLLSLELAVTNVNIQTIDDIRRAAASIEGYKNLIVSSVSAQQIGRLQ